VATGAFFNVHSDNPLLSDLDPGGQWRGSCSPPLIITAWPFVYPGRPPDHQQQPPGAMIRASIVYLNGLQITNSTAWSIAYPGDLLITNKNCLALRTPWTARGWREVLGKTANNLRQSPATLTCPATACPLTFQAPSRSRIARNTGITGIWAPVIPSSSAASRLKSPTGATRS